MGVLPLTSVSVTTPVGSAQNRQSVLRSCWLTCAMSGKLSSCSLQIFQPEVDVLEQLKRVHSDEHLRTLESAFDRAGGFLTPTVNLDGDTVVSPGTRAACWRAARLTVSAVDEVLSSTSSIRRAFVMVRPGITPSRQVPWASACSTML